MNITANSALKPFSLLIACALLLMLIGGCASQHSRTPQSQVTTPAVQNKSVKQQNADATKKTAAADTKNAKALAAAKEQENPVPKLELSQKGVTINWIENGKIRMSASVTEFQGHQITEQGVFLNFNAKLFDNGKLTTTMSAPKVVIDTTNRVLTATGGVTLNSLDRKTQIKSSWMKWYSKQQKVIGDGGVKITSEAWNAEGAAFVADTALKSFRIMNSAKGLVSQ